MKLILVQILIFLSVGLKAQSDSIKANMDLCQNLFKSVQIDSTYSSFYVEDFKDTIYFNNLRCVMIYQLTTRETILWKTKTGLANGFLEFTFKTSSGRTTKVGDFYSGYFKSGNEVQYFENGEIKCFGKYINSQRSGIWKWYNESGELKFKCEYIDGICLYEDCKR